MTRWHITCSTIRPRKPCIKEGGWEYPQGTLPLSCGATHVWPLWGGRHLSRPYSAHTIFGLSHSSHLYSAHARTRLTHAVHTESDPRQVNTHTPPHWAGQGHTADHPRIYRGARPRNQPRQRGVCVEDRPSNAWWRSHHAHSPTVRFERCWYSRPYKSACYQRHVESELNATRFVLKLHRGIAHKALRISSFFFFNIYIHDIANSIERLLFSQKLNFNLHGKKSI